MANHVSFVDQIVLHVLDMPMVVALKDTFAWPVTGTLMRAVQVRGGEVEGMMDHGAREEMRGGTSWKQRRLAGSFDTEAWEEER